MNQEGESRPRKIKCRAHTILLYSSGFGEDVKCKSCGIGFNSTSNRKGVYQCCPLVLCLQCVQNQFGLCPNTINMKPEEPQVVNLEEELQQNQQPEHLKHQNEAIVGTAETGKEPEVKDKEEAVNVSMMPVMETPNKLELLKASCSRRQLKVKLDRLKVSIVGNTVKVDKEGIFLVPKIPNPRRSARFGDNETPKTA